MLNIQTCHNVKQEQKNLFSIIHRDITLIPFTKLTLYLVFR